MVTLFLQYLVGFLALAFGVLALKVGASARGFPDLQQRAWILTGLAFTLGGLDKVLVDSWAVAAFFSGKGTPVYDSYLVAATVGNHSRIVLKLSYGVILACFAAFRGVPARRFYALAFGVFALSLLAGGMLGWMEGRLEPGRHFPLIASSETVEMMVLLAALFVALLNSAVDRLLWASIAVYAVRQALNAIWWSAMTWFGTGSTWVPSSRWLMVQACVAYTIMLVLAVRCLQAARRGGRVPALLEPFVGREVPILG